MSKPRKKEVLSMHVYIGSIEINGQPAQGFEYRRTEYSDGTYEETGLPPGLHSKPTLGELLSMPVEQTKKKGKRKP